MDQQGMERPPQPSAPDERNEPMVTYYAIHAQMMQQRRDLPREARLRRKLQARSRLPQP